MEPGLSSAERVRIDQVDSDCLANSPKHRILFATVTLPLLELSSNKRMPNRVANYHKETIVNLAELIAAAGLKNLDDLQPCYINRRVQGTDVRTYEQLYPTLAHNCLVTGGVAPDDWKHDWQRADANKW